MKYFSKFLAPKTIMRLILCTLVITSSAYAKECFIASKNNKLIYVEGECDKRYSPCSTFKIAISLMGFDAGILVDEQHPTWDFKSGYVDWLDRWKQPHNPKTWFDNSCVWYSQVITKTLGAKKFSNYLHRLAYGNKDVSGDHYAHNGLTHSWLSSSLKITPKEQILFLNKLVSNSLPVSIHAQEKTKSIMYSEDLEGGWQLYGKTGNGPQLDVHGNKIQDRQAGWFVGFIQKGDVVITFVQFIADDCAHDTYASLRAKSQLKSRIKSIIARYADSV